MKNDLKPGINVLFLNIDAVLEIIHTPPQVDVSASKNRRTGKQKNVPVSSILQRIAHISPLHPLIASHFSIVTSLSDFLIDRMYALIIRTPKKLAVFFEMRQGIWRIYTGNNDIQTCSLATDNAKRNRRGEPVFEGGQKKDGNRPPPKTPDTSKKEQPRREGDKGSQRVKQPKKESQRQA
jgi:hypothetical protein